jgi:hypothetical protein
METLFGVDWRAMFVPALGLIEVIVRGPIMYLALFRAGARRTCAPLVEGYAAA